MKRYLEAKEEETKFKIGDKVRYIITKSVFEKGTQPTYSKTIHKVIAILPHSYILDNGKRVKYYNMQLIKNAESSNKERIQPTTEEIKKEKRKTKKFKSEGLTLDTVIESKRKRETTKRFHY